MIDIRVRSAAHCARALEKNDIPGGGLRDDNSTEKICGLVGLT